jgi:hypothetical protein
MFTNTENKSFLGKKGKSSNTLKPNIQEEEINKKYPIFSITKIKKKNKKPRPVVSAFAPNEMTEQINFSENKFNLSNSLSKNYCKNNFFNYNKESFLNNEVNLNNLTIKSFNGDIYNLDEDLNNLDNVIIEKNLVSPFSGASLSKKNFRSTWDKEEEVSLLAVYLLFKLLEEKIKFSYISRLITTKNSSQVYQHLYRQKNSFDLFSKVFFCYFECKKINNEDYLEYTLEQLFNIFKINIMNSEYIKFFFENVTDKKCLKFVRNIYSYLTFEPKLYINGKKYEKRIKENTQAQLVQNENNYTHEHELFSPIKKISPRKKKNSYSDSKHKFASPLMKLNQDEYFNSTEGEINKLISNNFLDCQNLNTINNVNNNTSNLTTYFQEDYSNKLICNFKIKNMSLKIEGETYEKLKSFSSSSKNLVIDDNFFVNYLISKFKANSSN